MDQIIITKNNGDKVTLFRYEGTMGVTSAEQICDLSGQDVVNISMVTAERFQWELGYTLDVFGRLYRINTLPNAIKVNDRRFEYDVVFEGLQYDLIKVQYLDMDTTGFSTGSTFFLMANIATFAELIVLNLNRVYNVGQWELGEVPIDTEVQNIDFQNETCLQVLQKLCDLYNTNFDIERLPLNRYKLNIRKPEKILIDTFKYGRARGLYALERTKANDKNIVTRLFAYGASKNLPLNYRAGSLRLKLPFVSIPSEGQPYIEDQQAIDKYGVIEASIIFEDIFPNRTGTVTAINVNNRLQFTDSDMDFNLTEIMGSTSTYMIAGTAPKIVFKTGSLAGYEFNLNANTQNNGYVHTDKRFTLLPYTNEQNMELPSATEPAFQIQVGDTYTIVDVAMPQSYITAAEDLLELTAGQHLLDNAKPRVQYALTIDSNYIKAKEVVPNLIINYFNAGDFVNVIDGDLSIDGKSQIQSLKRDLLKHYKYEITLGDEIPNGENRRYRLKRKNLLQGLQIRNVGLTNVQAYQVNQIANNVVINNAPPVNTSGSGIFTLDW